MPNFFLFVKKSMEYQYQILYLIFIALGIFDIVVGVANDAVNFLNTSLGAKVASFKTIMIMASIGLVLGTLTSNGMMEIARKGLFHPQYITFDKIIYMFLAVLFSDILLLNFFNSLGLPTSTTVSIVFNILGAALGVAVLTSKQIGIPVIDFINAEKSLTIISGILISVIFALFFGVLIQWFARLIFSFNYLKNLRYFGAFWAAIVFSAIIYFLFIKGLKDSFLVDTQFYKWVYKNQTSIVLINFFASWLVFQILILLKINVLKGIVLLGTTALAMSFAGNDLVNFIGVPLAAINSIELWKTANMPEASQFFMTMLNNPIKANFLYLTIASLTMILTLWLSKQARYVTQTEINLTRQEAGYERFGSTEFSRAIVRLFVNISNFFGKITPISLKNFLNKRFDTTEIIKEKGASFDLIRASVTMMVASSLIALGTSLKLPLSTTYVTFITAMGTALADRAWGKESAVYRVTGVISVIIGWFLTALVALLFSLIISIILFYTKFIGGILFLIFLTIFVIYTRRLHEKEIERQRKEAEIYNIETYKTDTEIFQKSLELVINNLSQTIEQLSSSFSNFTNSSRKEIKENLNEISKLRNESKIIKQNVYKIVRSINTDNIQTAQYYAQITDALRDLSNAAYSLIEKYFLHIDNSHDIPDNEKILQLSIIHESTIKLLNTILLDIQKFSFDNISELKELRALIFADIEKLKLLELKSIQKGKSQIINSELIINTLIEYKNINIFAIRLVKAVRRYHRALFSVNDF